MVIHNNVDKFNKIIIVFTDMKTSGDYRQWIQNVMAKDNVTFIENDEVSSGKDWRDVAVQKALKLSTSEWIWFTEQDFTPIN